jgi:hypothetical protein
MRANIWGTWNTFIGRILDIIFSKVKPKSYRALISLKNPTQEHSVKLENDF